MGSKVEIGEPIIIDSFLHEQDFNAVRGVVMSNAMKWKFSNAVREGDKEDGNFQFTHRLFCDHQIQSESFWDIMPPVLYGLGAVSLIDAKINLQTASDIRKIKGFHTDIPNTSSHRTAVFCFSTCNGATLFKDSKREVESVQNRLIDFSGGVVHTGIGQTDTVSRVILNINYYPHDKRVFGPAVKPLSEAISEIQNISERL